jgi:hypothetical protein
MIMAMLNRTDIHATVLELVREVHRYLPVSGIDDGHEVIREMTQTRHSRRWHRREVTIPFGALLLFRTHLPSNVGTELLPVIIPLLKLDRLLCGQARHARYPRNEIGEQQWSFDPPMDGPKQFPLLVRLYGQLLDTELYESMPRRGARPGRIFMYSIDGRLLRDLQEASQRLFDDSTMPPDVADRSAPRQVEPLTEREQEVLELIPNTEEGGITGKEICEVLGRRGIIIEQSTLTRHIIPKLKHWHGVRNRRTVGYYRATEAVTAAG